MRPSLLRLAACLQVTLRCANYDNIWRLPCPVGCPDTEDDSLQWWRADVWNTL